MVSTNDFQIKTREDGTYTVQGAGYDQYLDFENSGTPITTETRAIEIRDLLINMINNPVAPSPTQKTPEERIADLETENTAMKAENAAMKAALDDIILNGLPA
jgi:hypothetical protein